MNLAQQGAIGRPQDISDVGILLDRLTNPALEPDFEKTQQGAKSEVIGNVPYIGMSYR
jgi:hypothetical protein